MSIAFRDRLKCTISNTPGTSGNFVISTASPGFVTFTSGDNALTFDVLIQEGNNWELRKDCTYTHSGTTLSRGTLQSSSSGSAIDFTTSAVITCTLLAERAIPITVSSATSGDVIKYNGTDWVNSALSFAASGANSDITSLSGITGGISEADYVTFDTTNAQTPGVGKLIWDATNGCLQVGLVGGNVNLQIGQEQVIYAFNGTGSTITDGQIVYIVGAQGNNASIGLASNSSETTSNATIGMATESIANGARGFVTIAGIVNNLNTNAYNEGDQLWLGSTAGSYTNVKPDAPAHSVSIGYVTRKHATVGSILVHIQNGYELDELHDVKITSVADKNLLQYDNTNHYWKNVTFDAILPTQTGNAGKYLKTDGATSSWANGNTNIPFTLGDGTSKTLPIGGATTGSSLTLNSSLTLGSSALIYTGAGNYGWKDITGDIITKGSGVNNPTWGTVRNGISSFLFDAGTMNECWINYHINHDIALGTPIYLHVHWVNPGTNTGTVRWGFEYTIAKGHQQEAFPATSTVYVEQACTGQYTHMIAEIATGITSASIETDSLVMVRIFRDAAHANDTCTNAVALVMADVHYQANTFATKNRAPNFYA